MPRPTSPKKKPAKRYRIVMTLVVADVIVTIAAKYETKDQLREKWTQAKVLFGTGKLATAEAWDDKKPELFKALPENEQFVHPPEPLINQPTIKKPQTRKGAQKKNVVQQGDNRREPRKGSRA